MPMTVDCPFCRTRYVEVPDHYAGRSVRCKKCKGKFTAGGEAPPLTEVDPPRRWKTGNRIAGVYEVIETLGEGAFGVVHKVRHHGWNMDLAVKSPRPEVLAAVGSVERFKQEAETWVHIGLHPHIVTCHYVREIEDLPRVFAEYVAGGSLKDRIRGKKAADLSRVLDIAIQFAWGLEYAHSLGLVHQDIKPANVMMTLDGTVKVTDFGLARTGIRRSSGASPSAADPQATLLGYTPAYASPEQMEGKPVSRKTDLWSFGLCLFELFSGKVLWPVGSVAAQILEEFLSSPDRFDPFLEMPPAVAELLRQCFRHDPDSRPKSMDAVADILLDIYREHTKTPYPRVKPKGGKGTADDLNNRGLSLFDLDKREEAIRLWEEALQKEPHHPEAGFNLGILLWRSGRKTDEELLQDMEEVRTSHPGDGKSLYLLGLAHMERHDFAAAMKCFENAEDRGPFFPEFRNVLEECRRRLPTTRKALRDLEGHTNQVNSVVLGHSGKTALSGGYDRDLRLWDLSTGTCLKVLRGHEDCVNSIAVEATGPLALSGGRERDKRLILWDLAAGTILRTFDGHKHNVLSVYLSRDGRLALSGSLDTTARLWDTANGTCLQVFSGEKIGVHSVALSRDGRFVLGGGISGNLHLWDTSTGKLLRSIEASPGGLIQCVDLAADAKTAASGDIFGNLCLWDLETGACLRRFKGHSGEIFGACFSEDGKYLLSAGGWEKKLRLWEVETGCNRTTLTADNGVLSAALDPEGTLAVTSCRNEIRIWELHLKEPSYRAPFLLCGVRTSEELSSLRSAFEKEMEWARSAMARSDWNRALRHLRLARETPGFSRDPAAIELWKALYGKLPRKSLKNGWTARTIQAFRATISFLDLSPDGRLALVLGKDTEALAGTRSDMRLFDTADGTLLQQLEAGDRGFEGACFSLCGHFAYFARGSTSPQGDRSLGVWNLRTGIVEDEFPTTSEFQSALCAVPKGKRVFLQQGSVVVFYDLATPEFLFYIKDPEDSMKPLYPTPDGRFLLTGTPGGVLRLWDLATRTHIRTFALEHGAIRRISVSGDGRLVAGGGKNGSIRLWNLEDGTGGHVVGGYTGGGLALSHDGRIVAGSVDNRICVWDIGTGELLRTFEGHSEPPDYIRMSRDSGVIVSAGRDGSLRRWILDWEIEEGEPAPGEDRLFSSQPHGAFTDTVSMPSRNGFHNES
ncbi:MAG: protein kinase [Syntrophobacteraceae bacterium]|nr:protein kinase [Syntrophobacteraceae bacterium]